MHDTAPLLSPVRVATLPAAERRAWMEYLARSRQQHARDTAAMAAELRASGRRAMQPAPRGSGVGAALSRSPAWLGSDSARRLAEAVLSYQAPNGGWSKNVDYTRGPRQPGMSYFSEDTTWRYIATLDNGATTEEIRFLVRTDSARADPRYERAVVRGLEYLVAAQFPTGCWPQIYPLQGSYHDAATFNDDAIRNVLGVLRQVADSTVPFVPTETRQRAAAALQRGLGCVLASQVVVNGERTAWGQQHDPLTLRPTSGRSYEPAALASEESASLVHFLMGLAAPSPAIVRAVQGAMRWFRQTAIYGYTYEAEGERREQPGAGPLWARLYEIGTNRPVFSDRNGIVLYDWTQLRDRRTGYAWYTTEPLTILREYDRWARRYASDAPATSTRATP